MGLILPIVPGETHALGLAGMEQQEGRELQHLAGKPCTRADPCPQVSPPLSLRLHPLQQPDLWLCLMAGGSALLCWPLLSQPGSGIRVQAAMAGPRALASLQAQPVWLGRSWGWWHWGAEMR